MADLTHALAQPRIAGLDALRAIAVLNVLAWHSVEAHWLDGVELFFVLSGFLITWLLLQEAGQQGRISLAAFYRRRVARLMPLFWAYLLLGLILLAALHRPIPWGAVVASLLYAVNYFQALRGAPSHYLSHCWSLAVEEQFYLLWPVLLVWLMRRGVRLEGVLAGVIGTVWILRPMLFLLPRLGDVYVQRALESRADHLAAGCLLAVALRHPRVRRGFEACARRRWVAAALAASIVASTQLHANLAYKNVVGFAIEPLLMAGLLPLVMLLAQEQHLVARLLNARIVVLMGQASYGMYLVHPWILQPACKAIERLTGSAAAGVFGAMAVVACVAFASLRWFEDPMRHRLNGPAAGRAPAGAGAGAGASAVSGSE